MTATLGIHVAREAIHAVLLRRSVVAATAIVERNPREAVTEQLDRLRAAIPAGMWRKPAVVVALDSDLVTSKRIEGLPPVADTRHLERLVCEGADRFFIGVPARIVVARATKSLVRAEAFNRHMVDQLARFASRSGSRRCVIGSVASVVEQGTHPGHLDGGLPLPFHIASRAAGMSWTELPTIVAHGGVHQNVSEWRAWAARGAAVAALGLLAVSSEIATYRINSSVARDLARVSGASRLTANAQRQLDDVTSAIRLIERFRASRLAPMALLGSVSAALPDESALLAFSVDTARGSASIVASDALRAVAALDAVPELLRVRLVGPVTRDRIGDRPMERAAIGFDVGTRP